MLRHTRTRMGALLAAAFLMIGCADQGRSPLEPGSATELATSLRRVQPVEGNESVSTRIDSTVRPTLVVGARTSKPRTAHPDSLSEQLSSAVTPFSGYVVSSGRRRGPVSGDNQHGNGNGNDGSNDGSDDAVDSDDIGSNGHYAPDHPRD